MITRANNMVESVTNSIIESVKTSGNVYNACVEAMTITASKIITITDETKEGLIKLLGRAIVQSIEGVIEWGGDLNAAAKGIMVGIIRAGGIMERQTFGATCALAELIIQSTIRSGGDVTAAGVGLLEGFILEAKKSGIDVRRAASEVATAAARAAFEEDRLAAKNLTDAFAKKISGIRVVLNAHKEEQSFLSQGGGECLDHIENTKNTKNIRKVHEPKEFRL